MSKPRSFEELNFPATAKTKFDALVADEDWSWAGIAKAFRDRYNDSDMDELIRCLTEVRG